MANYAEMKKNLLYFTMGGLGLTVQSGTQDVMGQLINRAYADIFEGWDWSFRLSNTVINSAAPKMQGSITVTQGSPAILGTGTNFTYSDVGSFIWVGGQSQTPLPIADVSGPQLATLASPYA